MNNPPIVIKGTDIREVTVCNLATEPAARIYVPKDGRLIVDLHEDTKAAVRGSIYKRSRDIASRRLAAERARGGEHRD